MLVAVTNESAFVGYDTDRWGRNGGSSMSKFLKLFAAVALIAGAIAAMPATAEARHWGHHGGWHGGWRGGFGPSWGFGYPYAYYPQPYYYAPACGWVRVRVWRGDHWTIRRVRRCG
jgi:hypothetical protein